MKISIEKELVSYKWLLLVPQWVLSIKLLFYKFKYVNLIIIKMKWLFDKNEPFTNLLVSMGGGGKGKVTFKC